MFIDTANITVEAGRGGNGAISFRREKFVSKGGPDGGDGGHGGSVSARADNNSNTLAKFRHTRKITAEAGEAGKKRNSHGKNGEDAEIIVPVGTVFYHNEVQIADLNTVGQTIVLAKGGRGGFGNAHFTSSKRQAPKLAELGEPGAEYKIRMELKTVADVGLVGLPNAGKSTLLSVISNARPEIADYPFTTLVPNLGVAEIYENSLVVADIPGLIAGAAQGKGLGDDFLRHIERTKVLLHLIDAGADDIVEDFNTIQHELRDYRVNLTDKPQIVVLTKAEVVPEEIIQEHKRQLEELGQEVLVISSVAHSGLSELLSATLELVRNLPEEIVEESTEIPTITLADDPKAWWLDELTDGVEIKGTQIEGFALRSDFANPEAMARFRDILHKRGIDRELIRSGVSPGDKVLVAGKKFIY